MAETAQNLFDVADQAFKRGQWKQALAAYGGVGAACPEHFRTRFRVADCLLNIGQRDAALEVYKGVAWHAIKGGYPLMGLVAAKMVLLLDPNYEDILIILAELYSVDSDRVDGGFDGPPQQELDDSRALALSTDDAALVERCVKIATATHGAEYPRKLPRIPLFSHLDEDAFIQVLSKLRLRRYADSELIIRQGERGESFFIIADGDVAVARDLDNDGGVTLAHLHRGAVFGELALISDEPRHAAVVARGDVDVLEVRRSDLIVAAAHLETVTSALKAFTRERFLGNLTATHPLFTPLSRDERHRMMEQFEPVSFDKGDALIHEGEPGPGLYLLLGGSVEVFKVVNGERIHLANLKGADLCGEMSLLGDKPTNATVVALEPAEALFLGRNSFKHIVDNHPALTKYLAGLSEDRIRQNRAMLQAKGLLEDDEHIMI